MTAVGVREDDPSSAYVMEWDGEAWAPVCPRDDIAIVARNDAGWLICGVCGRRPDEIGRGGR